jgi:hypothetical protein
VDVRLLLGAASLQMKVRLRGAGSTWRC